MAVADQTLVVASERAIVDGLAGAGARAFVGRPRVFLASLLPFPDVPDGTARLIDLALDGVSLAMAGATLRIVEPADLASAEGPALREVLGDGHLAVVVGDPARFWAIDPASGATRSVLEPGLRVGFNGGGNYVNSTGGGMRYVIDSAGRTVGYMKDGKFYRYTKAPPSKCSGGNEYVVLLGCVSIPASMTVGMVTGVVVVAMVAWSVVALQVWLL